MIIDHNSESYINKWDKSGANRYNGAYYYSVEIVRNIIPNVKTDRNWVTVNCGECLDHSIVFIHNNKHPEFYDWLRAYNDLVLVCGVPETVDKVKHLADHAIYLPLSVDVEEVRKYIKPKTKYKAFAGRKDKLGGCGLAFEGRVLGDMPREQLLEALGEYEVVYAVGRCAIEAKILGCNIEPYDPRFPDPNVWQILDNREAAKILQEKLNEIDK